jgi:predicted methyltransferase MtxX (methanogen marker protein 4)
MITAVEELARKFKSKIAIGCSNDPRYRSITISGAIQAKKRDFVDPIIVGHNLGQNSNIEIKNCQDPILELKRMLIDGEVDGIVRGSLVAREFMNEIKNTENDNIDVKTAKLALIENEITQKSFFIAPIGVGEGNNIEDKVFILENCPKYISLLNKQPKVSVLSAGKPPIDLGINDEADKTIHNAELIVSKFKDKMEIFSDGILIENSIEKDANFVLCMNGITGNLLYRSLVNLTAEWKSYGAILISNNPFLNKKIIIDTSQFASLHEYRRSLIFASALAGASKS